MKIPVSVFLSAVSNEFHKPDPKDPRRFVSYREFLSESLRAIRQPHQIVTGDDLIRRLDPDAKPGHLGVVSQENLAPGSASLLGALEDEVRDATTVVHLVGEMAGYEPKAAELRRLRERPDLLRDEPELRAALGDFAGVTYTQWELWFAFEHKKARFVFLAEPAAQRSPSYAPDEKDRALQQSHLARIKITGEHREPFTNQRDVANRTVRAFVRQGLIDDPAATPDPAALAAARELLEKIVPEIVASIKKPDPAKIFLPDRAGIAAWLAALDTAAENHGLNRTAVITLLDERLGFLLERAAGSAAPEPYLDLGFTLLALGEYPAAITAAHRAIALAGALPQDTDPERLRRREHLLNAHHLLHDTAAANHNPALAIRALTDGGAYIDKTIDPELWADYHETLAEFLLAQAQWQAADDLISDIIDIREEHSAENGNALAKTLCLWGRLLSEQSKHQGAHDVAQRAATIYGAEIPPNIRGMAIAWNDQATELMHLGLFAKAEPLMRRALGIDEASHGPDHPYVAIRLNNLAQLLGETNRHGEAEPLMRRALGIAEASHGPDHPNVAIRLNNLAQLLGETNRHGEAEPLMRRALGIDEASYGTDHPRVATDLNNLATLLNDTNRHGEAEPLMRRALGIDEASYGGDHPRVAIDLNNIAQLLQATNRHGEAEPLMRRALAIAEASYGTDHPMVAIDLNNIAQLLQATNRHGSAEPLMRRALGIDEASYGTDHPRVATDLNNLATLLNDTNRHGEAEPLMRRALGIDEASYGGDHPRVAIDLNNIAQLLQATNRHGEAEPLMRRALAIAEASYGTDHPMVAIDLNNIAQLLQATNRHGSAEPLMRRALAIDEASYGPEHPRVARDLNNLARLLQDTNRLGEAEPLMRRALEIFESSLGTVHPNSIIVRGNLDQLLAETEK